jgi:hypothetical protein
VLPEFTNDLSTLKLQFYANTTASSVQTAGSLVIGYVTDPNDPNTFTAVETLTPKTESLNRASSAPYGPFYFVNVTDTGRMAIRFVSNAFSTSWNLDDITVSTIASCAEPIYQQTLNITSTSAEFSWIHTDGATYDILLWPTGSQDTTYIYGVSLELGPHYIDNLTPNTQYTWIARTICGDGEYSYAAVRAHFTTPHSTLSLPYVCDFEDTSYSYDEFSFSGYGNSQWTIGSATNATSGDGASHSLYISDNQGLTNTYSGGYSYSYASLNLNFPNIPIEYHLEFDFKGVGECGWDEFSVHLLDGGASLPNSGAPSGVTLISAQCNQTSWTHFDVVLPDVIGSSKKIVFYWHNDNYIFGNPPAAIDNIEINGNSCARPSHLTATEVGDYYTSITWQENATSTDWTIFFKSQNEDNYQEIPVSDSTSYTFQNLTPNTTYICFIKADCDGGYSNPSNPITFRTQCSVDGISDLPYTENFDVFEVTDGSNYVPCWQRLTSDNTHFVYVNTGDFESNCLDFHYTPNCYTMAVLPMFNSSIALNNLQLNFNARRHSLATGALEVGAMTDPNDATTFEVIDTVPITSTYAWNNYTIYCNDYDGAGQYLAFRVNNAGYYTVAIDNLVVDNLPGCLPPSGINVTNITQQSAEISWSGSGNSYKVYLVGNPDTLVYTTTQHSIVVENLIPSSTYSVLIQSICGNDYSVMSNKTSFHTECGPITITVENPWKESFENYAGSNDAIDLSPCWAKTISIQTTGGTFPTVYNYAQASHSGKYSLEMQGTSNMVVLPEFTNELNTLQLSLWLNTNAPDAASAGILTLGLITDVTNPATFVAVANIPATAFGRVGTDAPYTDFMGPFSFSGITPQAGQRIAFRYFNSNYSDISWNLDDLSVTLIPDCPSPAKHSLTVTNVTSHEASLSWVDEDPTHNTWCVFYKPVNTNVWMIDTVYFTTSTIIGGLESDTKYEVYVTTYCDSYVPFPDATIERYFTTTIEPTQLPYSTDFTLEDDVWRFNNGNCTNYWTIHTYTPTGNHYALFITHNGIGASYNETATSIVSAEKVFTVGQSAQIEIDYDIKIGGEVSESWDYDYMKMFLATSDETFEAATTVPAWAASTYNTHAYNFSQYSSQINSLSPYVISQTGDNTIHVNAIMDNPNTSPTENSVAKLVFAWVNDYAGSTQPGAIITNLSVVPVTCPQPSQLTVTNIGSNEADVYWLAGQNETNWIVEYKKTTSSLWNTVTSNSNSCHLTGLTSNSQYELRLQADCGDETSQFVYTTFTTTSCVSTNQCPYIFHLSDSYGDGWNGGSISVLQNGILLQNVTLSEASNADFTMTLCDNSSIVLVWNSGMYDYECSFTLEGPDGTIVYSNSNLGNVGNTTLFTFTTNCSTIPVCDIPTNLTANNISTSSATLNWSMGDANAWVIEYKSASSATWGSEIYVVNNNYTLTNLEPNTTYQVRVKANCITATWSDWSDVLLFSTLSDSSSVVEPSVITNSASAITHNSATLNGAIISQGNQTILTRGFEWKVSGDDPYTVEICNTIGTVFSTTITGLSPTTNYTFRAFVSTANTVTYGEEMTFTTEDYVSTPCEVPTDIDTVAVTDESITIQWTDNNEADEWNVRHRTSNGVWTTNVANTPTYTISDLTSNTTYYIQVQAVCSADELSDWSSTLTVVTTVGLNDHLLNSIKLYPNPASDEITVEWDTENPVSSIELFDVYGKLIATADILNLSQQTRINVSSLASGMYFVRVTTEQGTATKPFVKR